MGLPPGTRLGVYEVVAPLGAGGMGEVYRARDTKLGRDVALKILSEAFANDADRVARFEREAKTLAALNHPNIAHLYGFEQSGETSAFIMELVDGEDLSQRLARGAVPPDEALTIARQIAEALEAAHEQGIIHRDLKPANIKLRRDGAVKVLDFGLAKALDGAGRPGESLENSPTITSPAFTQGGIILGTAAYMSPEQARGLAVDKRTDIWAFGAVLFELLSGRRLFDGGTVSDSIAAVLTREPDWSALPSTTPAPIVELIRRCLRKDPKRRLRDIGDAGVVLDEVTAAPASGSGSSIAIDRPAHHRRWLMPWALAGAMTLVAATAMWMAFTARPAEPDRISARVAITLPPTVTMFLSRGSSVAVSPDGHTVVFTATADQRTQLYTRALDRMEITPLPGTNGAANPFFSPDGQWVGFTAEGKLKKVNLQGRTVVTVTDAPNIRGEAWGPDDTILLTPNNNTGLWRVSATGGQAQPLTKPETGELSHRWPQFVPGGKAVLFTIWNDTGFEGSRIAVQRLDNGERKTLVQGGGYGRIVEVDADRAYLVYAQADGLLAAPFNLDRLELSGPMTPVVDAVSTNLSGGAHFAFSKTGLLAYLPGSLSEANKTLLWVDRTGKETAIREITDLGAIFAVTRDGGRVIRLNTQGPDRDLWVEDLVRGGSTRLTNGGFRYTMALTADQRRVVYSSGLPNGNLYWRSIDGAGEEERLTTSPNAQFAESVSPDGTVAAFTEIDPVRNGDIWLVSLDRDHKVRPFLQTPFAETNADFSPDGRWLAYQSNESGRFEIYITSFPEPGSRIQVTTAGGFRPRWSKDGRELYYRFNDRMLMAPILPGPELKSGPPQLLFSGNYLGDGDFAQDTGRFVMMRDNGQDTAGKTIYVVMNWFDELRSRLASNSR